MSNTSFALLLKMLVAGAALDGATAASRVGIARNRFYEISCGRIRPNDDEVRDLFRILLTAPVSERQLLKQFRDDPNAIVWTLWRALQPVPMLSAIVDARLSIDRLSLTANTRSERAIRLVAARLGKQSETTDRYYRERYALPGLTLQLDPRKSGLRFARLDLYREELDAPKASLELFDILNLSSARLTRVDVATDLDVSSRNVHVIPSSKRKVVARWYWGDRGLESLYLFTSPKKIRIYDKRVQLGTDADRTRIEAEVRDLGLAPQELLAVPNPYTRISLVQFADGGSLTSRLLAREARLFGVPAVLSELSAEERATFTKQMQTARWIPHPRDVFEANWKRVAGALVRRLRW